MMSFLPVLWFLLLSTSQSHGCPHIQVGEAIVDKETEEWELPISCVMSNASDRNIIFYLKTPRGRLLNASIATGGRRTFLLTPIAASGLYTCIFGGQQSLSPGCSKRLASTYVDITEVQRGVTAARQRAEVQECKQNVSVLAERLQQLEHNTSTPTECPQQCDNSTPPDTLQQVGQSSPCAAIQTENENLQRQVATLHARLGPETTCEPVFGLGGDSGIQTVNISGQSVTVYCDQSNGGGWTVLQRRVNKTLNFYRGWADYIQGFGDMDNNFWIGLKNIHLLTSSRKYALRVLFWGRDEMAEPTYAHYQHFYVDSGAEAYTVHVDDYSGNAGDYFSRNSGLQFTTYDMDNDRSLRTNCAIEMVGAWWYGVYKESCGLSDLNANRLSDRTKFNLDGLVWGGVSQKSLTRVEMRIRRSYF